MDEKEKSEGGGRVAWPCAHCGHVYYPSPEVLADPAGDIYDCPACGKDASLVYISAKVTKEGDLVIEKVE